MANHTENTQHTRIITGLLAGALFFTLGASAWANPEMGGHPGMPMEGHGQMGMGGGMDCGMHGLQPHNAAEHFLKMGPSLNLTDDQTKQLTKLRDDYIQKNATAEEQIKAAYGDIGRTLFADDVDLNAADALFGKIGKMEGQLWHAYAQQLHDIKAMLTPEQKKALKDMWKEGHGKMGEWHGDMPMHQDMK